MKLIKIFLFLIVSLPLNSFAQNLASFSISGVDYALEVEGGDNFLFAIKSDKQLSLNDSNVLVLENPNRVVLDVPGISSKAAKNISVKNKFISAIRIGIHPDKTRIVLDIKSPQNPNFNLKKVGKSGAMLELSFSGTAAANLGSREEQMQDNDEEEEQPPVKPTTTTSSTTLKTTTTTTTTEKVTTTTTLKVTTTSSTTTSTTEESYDEEDDIVVTTTTSTSKATTTTTLQKSAKDLVSSQIATNTQTNIMQPSEENPKVGTAVSSISYQVTENTKLPAVAIDAPGLKSYTLNKITPELYEMTMEDAYLLGNHLLLPQFPPENFRGFSVVVARQEKSKVILKIFVEDGTRLFPFIANNQLWVKVAE